VLVCAFSSLRYTTAADDVRGMALTFATVAGELSSGKLLFTDVVAKRHRLGVEPVSSARMCVCYVGKQLNTHSQNQVVPPLRVRPCERRCRRALKTPLNTYTHTTYTLLQSNAHSGWEWWTRVPPLRVLVWRKVVRRSTSGTCNMSMCHRQRLSSIRHRVAWTVRLNAIYVTFVCE
jgi:hypothetical protein